MIAHAVALQLADAHLLEPARPQSCRNCRRNFSPQVASATPPSPDLRPQPRCCETPAPPQPAPKARASVGQHFTRSRPAASAPLRPGRCMPARHRPRGAREKLRTGKWGNIEEERAQGVGDTRGGGAAGSGKEEQGGKRETKPQFRLSSRDAQAERARRAQRQFHKHRERANELHMSIANKVVRSATAKLNRQLLRSLTIPCPPHGLAARLANASRVRCHASCRPWPLCCFCSWSILPAPCCCCCHCRYRCRCLCCCRRRWLLAAGCWPRAASC